MLFSRKISGHDVYTQAPNTSEMCAASRVGVSDLPLSPNLSLSTFVIFPFSAIDFPCDTCPFSWRDKRARSGARSLFLRRETNAHAHIFSFSRTFVSSRKERNEERTLDGHVDRSLTNEGRIIRDRERGSEIKKL